MSIFLPLLAAAASAAPDNPPPAGQPEIVVTAGREEETEPMLTAPLAVEKRPGPMALVGLPMVTDLLRLLPGASVASAGPRGSQTQVRLLGAEANHTLLVVDGIRFNDPAAGNEPRFELLASDLFDRITLIPGGNSALWGSEAIGGVVLADTRDAWSSGRSLGARAEYGSLDSARTAAWVATEAGKVRVSATGAWLRSDGVDAFGSGGERDGFDNKSASLKLVFSPFGPFASGDSFEVGAVAHWIDGKSEFDGFDPVTFKRADTLDETHNRIGALRGWARAERSGWTLALDGSLLASANRNFLGDAPLNRTSGRRFTARAELSKKMGGHIFTAAAEEQSEHFRARDQVYFGASDQDRSRQLTALTGEWHAEWSTLLTTDLAVRRDKFSAFADATTVRAGVTVEPKRGLRLLANYSEGIAQPTFYDLYGFFPGSFVGNTGLRPERSTGWSAGAAYGWGGNELRVNLFTARLKDEIVDVFDPATFLSTTANATGTSRRRGIEADARIRFSRAASFLVSYVFLDAKEQQVAGGLAVKEVRRPRHSASAAGQGEIGRLSWGATLAWVGPRSDMDFDPFPARRVRLGSYLLASLQLAWKVSKRVEAYVRSENAFDAHYQDVVGYHTAGRTLYAGLRLSLGD